MKVSILMPVYNAGKYLRRSIASIQQQTMQDFEIVAVDDGSTDDSLAVLELLKRQDNRIKIISREEKGYAVTMNDALDYARGEFVLNVDPDDWIEPNMLERMLEEMDDKTDFVKCAFVFELPEGKQEEYYYCDEPVEFCPRMLDPGMKMRFFTSQVAIWTCLIRRSFIEEHKIRLNPTPGAAYQDAAFIFQIDACADKVRVIPDILYHYNKTNVNASTASTRLPMSHIAEYGFMADWCMKHPEYGIYVRSVLCKMRFGAYMWNMRRIKATDRLEFAMALQKDFIDDWNWIDVRMFNQQEFDVYMIGKNDPVEMVGLFKSVHNIIMKASEKEESKSD